MTDANDNVKVRVTRQRRCNAYGELSHASHVLLQNAERRQDGWYYECMTAILVTAFKFESFLNQMGHSLFPSWKRKEKLPWREKLETISRKLETAMDHDKRPYKTLTELFKFRNELAHGKPSFLVQEETLEEGNIEDIRRLKPLCHWEKLCNLDFAQMADRDSEEIIDLLLVQSGLDKSEFRSRGNSYSIGQVEPQTGENA